jgi:hypothetical protein
MVKIGRGQQNYRRCRCCHRLQSFVTMKKKCNQINNGCLEKFQKKLAILFLFTFFNLILDAPRTVLSSRVCTGVICINMYTVQYYLARYVRAWYAELPESIKVDIFDW